MTLHLVDIGHGAQVRPTRLRSIARAMRAQGIDPADVVAVGTATAHARAAGVDAGRWLGLPPHARRLARWTHGHGRVVAWGEWPQGVPDGVAWAERAPTSWCAVQPSGWEPVAGAPLVLWCAEPAAASCALEAVELAARLSLLGCPIRMVVPPGMARLDRATALACDMALRDALIVLEDHAALASISGWACLAIAAPTADGMPSSATQVGVPECLAAHAAAGTACLVPFGVSDAPWVLAPKSTGVNELALAVAGLLGDPSAREGAAAAARRAAADLDARAWTSATAWVA